MFRAIGFVIVLIAIRVFMPDVFQAFEQALIQFFGFVGDTLAAKPYDIVGDINKMNTAGFIPPAAPYHPIRH